MTTSDRPERANDDEQEDDAMIERAVGTGNTIYFQAEQMKVAGRLIKRVRELAKTIDEQGRATNDLTERIRKLNVWLLLVTVAIGAMTLVQIFLAVAAFKK
jgi:hypothetical protein